MAKPMTKAAKAAHANEKFRRWDSETARQESPREGRGAADRALGVGSAGKNEGILRDVIDKQYARAAGRKERARQIERVTGGLVKAPVEVRTRSGKVITQQRNVTEKRARQGRASQKK